MKAKITGHTLAAAALLLGALNALGLRVYVDNAAITGFFPFVTAVTVAVILLRRDRSPGNGLLYLVSAFVVTAVQIWGGGFGPAAFLYPVLFLWLKRESISGPVLIVAASAATVEFLATLSSSSGLIAGQLDVGQILDNLLKAIAAGIIPLVSLSMVEYLKEGRSTVPLDQREAEKPAETHCCAFPDDVARSLLPVLMRSTGANGIFLFVSDERGVSTLNEFIVEKGKVSKRYMAGPDDPVVQLLDSCSSNILHTRANRLAISGSEGLPWYIQDGDHPYVTVIQFRRDGDLHGFMVVDFDTEGAMLTAAPVLVDSAFLVSVSWEHSRETGSSGFLSICDEMASTSDVRGAVHRLISSILKIYNETTATVAILGEGSILRIFESMGPFSENRAGREFSVSEGFAGLAVKRKEPMRRLRMGVGQKSIRTFGDSDDPRRLVGSCCAIPLLDMGATIGVLTVESGEEQFFAPEDLFLLSSFGTVFSLAVSRNSLKESLRRLKESDRITELPLLSSFHDKLADMVRGVRSRAWSIAVLAVDIHGFSRINDTFGYKAGDRVLEVTARRLLKAVGDKAVVSRSGADSFLVCLQSVDRVSAEAYAARIHDEFDHAPVTVSGRQIPVTVSIGGAVSHVDKMIRKLPGIALKMVHSIREKPGMSSITEVGQFYESQN